MISHWSRVAAALSAAAVAAAPSIARAQELSPTDAAPAASAPEPGNSLNVDLGFASAYVFRGLNVFKASKQMDQHAFLAPAAIFKMPSGLSFAYWGAYQVSGGNTSQMLDVGLGGENDLIVGYDHALAPDLSLGFALTYYFYPFSKDSTAVPAFASYLEPSAKITWTTSAADLSLRALYYAGLQDKLKDFRYLYLNPAAAHSFTVVEEKVKLDVGLGLGIKVGPSTLSTLLNGNTVDVIASVALPIRLGTVFYVKPGVNLAWTDVKSDPAGWLANPASATLPAGSFGDGLAFFGGVNVGAAL